MTGGRSRVIARNKFVTLSMTHLGQRRDEMMKIVRWKSKIANRTIRVIRKHCRCLPVSGRCEEKTRREKDPKNRMNWAEARLLNGATVKQALTATTNHGCKKPGSAGFPSAPTVFAPVTSLPLSKNNAIIHRLRRPVFLSLKEILTYLGMQFGESRNYILDYTCPKNITC